MYRSISIFFPNCSWNMFFQHWMYQQRWKSWWKLRFWIRSLLLFLVRFSSYFLFKKHKFWIFCIFSLTESTLVVPQFQITVLTSKIPTILLRNPQTAVSASLPWTQIFAKFGWILITLISQKLHPLWVHVSIHLMWQVAVPEPITPFVELYLDNTVSFLLRLYWVIF